MDALLAPATRIMNRLGVAGKMALMGLVVTIPIVVLLVLLLQRIGADLAFSRQETLAVAVIQPAERLMKNVQAHRGTVHAILSGNAALKEKLSGLENAADAAIAQGDKADAEVGARLGTTSDWNQVKSDWNAIKAKGLEQPPAESLKVHTALVARLQEFVGKAGDQSNATLDPEMDSYYLQDMFAYRLPAVLEHLGVMRALSSGVAAKAEMDVAQRVKLETLAGFAAYGKKALDVDVAKAILGDPALKELLSEDAASFAEGAAAGLKMVREGILDSPAITADSTALFASFTKAIDAGYALAETAQKAFDAKIAARVAGLERERNLAIGAVALALLVSIYLFLAFRRAMVGAIREIRGGADRMAHGELDKPLVVAGHDELGDIAASMNAMQGQLLEKIQSDRAVAAENLRVRFALEGVSIPVTLSDEQHKLIFMNKAAEDLWQGMAGEIGRRVSGFSVRQMIGRSVVDFLEDDAARATYRADIEHTNTLDMDLAGRKLRVTVSPVKNAQGAYVGRVSQWLDRTDDVAMETEVASLVEAAVLGDLSGRLHVDGRDGFHLRLGEGLNRLMDVVAAGLEDVGRVLEAVARGSLTARVDATYEGTFGRLADSTNTTVERLREVVGNIKQATDAISQAAHEIASGNTDLSSRTEEQASSLQETASSMEEINATVKQNADNARQAKHLAANSNELARTGGEVMGKVSKKMDAIQESSHRIAEIVGVIDSIAFQTNILALNAAVEAARAGEQGRGFAVVATEVRTLAQRSAAAAREIKTLISSSVSEVEEGAKLVFGAADTMDDVVTSFDLVAGLVTEIADGSHEQSTGIEQVTLAVGQMDEVVQQNAALVEEAAAAAESLEEQARSLQSAVARFQLGTSGEGLAHLPAAITRSTVVPRKKAALAAPRKALAAPTSAPSQDDWDEF